MTDVSCCTKAPKFPHPHCAPLLHPHITNKLHRNASTLPAIALRKRAVESSVGGVWRKADSGFSCFPLLCALRSHFPKVRAALLQVWNCSAERTGSASSGNLDKRTAGGASVSFPSAVLGSKLRGFVRFQLVCSVEGAKRGQGLLDGDPRWDFTIIIIIIIMVSKRLTSCSLRMNS